MQFSITPIPHANATSRMRTTTPSGFSRLKPVATTQSERFVSKGVMMVMCSRLLLLTTTALRRCPPLLARVEMGRTKKRVGRVERLDSETFGKSQQILCNLWILTDLRTILYPNVEI